MEGVNFFLQAYCFHNSSRFVYGIFQSIGNVHQFQASIFHYGSISLITEPSRSTHLEAMRIAKEAGAILSYDPNLRQPLWPSAEAAREGIMSIFDQADIIKVFPLLLKPRNMK